MVEKEGEKISSRGKEEKKTPKSVLLNEIIKKIDYYAGKNSVSDVDLYYLMKEFFKEFLELNYEFSLDELLLELDKIYMDNSLRERTVAFIEKVGVIEYTDNPFSSEYVRELLREFSLLSRNLAKLTYPKQKNFWDKLGTLFVKEKKEKPLIKKEEMDNKLGSSLSEGFSGRSIENKPAPAFIKTDIPLKNTQLPDLSKPLEEIKDEAKIKEKVSATSTSKVAEDLNKNYLGTSADYKKYSSDIKDVADASSNEKSSPGYDWNADKLPEKINATEQKEKKDNKTEEIKSKVKDNKIPASKSGKHSKKEDFASLLHRAKKCSKKTELTELYKQIHERYEAENVEFQAKYYKDIMYIYTRISKMK